MDIILYSTGCPKCKVLIKKLNENDIPYHIVNDVKVMANLNIDAVPVLSVNNRLLNFSEAVAWVNNYNKD